MQRIKKYTWHILLVFAFFIWSIKLRYFFGTTIPLGYDPWIYIFLFHDYSQLLRNFDFSLLADRNQHEPLLGLLVAIINKLWVSSERLVRRWIGIASMLPGFVSILFFWKKDKPFAVLSARIYRISVPQYEAFFWAYFKQIIWISFMLTALFLLTHKKYFWFSIALLLTILLHRHTGLLTVVVAIVFVIIRAFQFKKIPYRFLIALWWAGILSLLFYFPLREKLVIEWITPVLSTFWWSWMWWIFMEKITYLKLAIIPIILSIIQAVLKFKSGKFDIAFVGWLVSIIWVLFSLVNYKRHLIFLDVFVIIMATEFLVTQIKRHKLWWSVIILSWLVWASVWYWTYVFSHNIPLISQEEFTAIKSFSEFLPQDAIILTSHRNYTPRIMWYSNKDRISPGWSDLDKWSELQRRQRWTSDWLVKCDMIKQTYKILNRPIYRRIGENQFQENISWWDCISVVDWWASRRLLQIHL